jgi:divalent metal cation (Fe/Co/Zn/Cd) transporter
MNSSPEQREQNFPAAIFAAQVPTSETIRQIHRIQVLTIIWMSVEAGVSQFAAWQARSPALFAFGVDSAIELISAIVVLWRFSTPGTHSQLERRTARIAGVLLLVLAAYVALISVVTLMGYNEPRPSFLGIIILIAAAILMPWLAKQKRKLSAATGSATLRADAAQSGLCAYLSLIALAGIVMNAVWHVRWADPVAALAVIPLILWEAKEAFSGKACGCC